ncbi:MAG: DUF4157 domain-containing protein [Nitrospira sp.]|nr:DUF4157 domain-containing protein [Nitrospira sp.]
MTRRLQVHSPSSVALFTKGAVSSTDQCNTLWDTVEWEGDCDGTRELLAHARTGAIPPLVHEVLASPGEPLESGLRAQMDARLRYDFGKVRVHRDGKAAASVAAAGPGKRGIVPC